MRKESKRKKEEKKRVEKKTTRKDHGQVSLLSKKGDSHTLSPSGISLGSSLFLLYHHPALLIKEEKRPIRWDGAPCVCVYGRSQKWQPSSGNKKIEKVTWE
jgi:hypothetical protein